MIWTRMAWGARNRHGNRVTPATRFDLCGVGTLAIACLILGSGAAQAMAATMPVAFQSGTLAVTSANSAGNETQNDKPAIPSTGGGIGAPLVKDSNVRLTAAPLTTGVAPGVSILPVGFTANTSATATVVQSADTAAALWHQP